MSSSRPADRRVILMDAAIEVFGERGWFATRLEEIAGRAGVTKPLVLRHWPSKDALFLEVRVRLTERLRGRLEEATRGGADPLTRIHRTVTSLAHFLIDHPGAWQILGPIRSDRAPSAPLVEHDWLHATVRDDGFRTPQWASPVAWTAEMGAIGLVAGAAHGSSREDGFGADLAVAFITWMTDGAASALMHLGAVPAPRGP